MTTLDTIERGTPSIHRHAPRPRFADVQLATGVRLHYEEQGDPAGQPIILLHGYSDSWFSFSRVLPLIPATYRVYALDQRGHGDSDRPASGYTPRDLAADVIAFMNVKGIVRATVVGHSMGSFIAQQVAVAAPGRVAGLVLIGSATETRNVLGIFELQQAVASFNDSAPNDPVPVEFVQDFQTSTAYQPVPAEFMDRIVKESLKLPARVWWALMGGMLATGRAPTLGESRIPILILWGERDAYFPRSEQDALLAMLLTARLKVYSETGHNPHWEQPEEFVRDLEAFLTLTEAR